MGTSKKKLYTAAGSGRLGNDHIFLCVCWGIYCTIATGTTTENSTIFGELCQNFQTEQNVWFTFPFPYQCKQTGAVVIGGGDIKHQRTIFFQRSMCAPWIVERTNICMSIEGTGKTSNTYSGAHIQWNDTFVWILGQCWKAQCHRYNLSYEILGSKTRISQQEYPDEKDWHAFEPGRWGMCNETGRLLW